MSQTSSADAERWDNQKMCSFCLNQRADAPVLRDVENGKQLRRALDGPKESSSLATCTYKPFLYFFPSMYAGYGKKGVPENPSIFYQEAIHGSVIGVVTQWLRR